MELQTKGKSIREENPRSSPLANGYFSCITKIVDMSLEYTQRNLSQKNEMKKMSAPISEVHCTSQCIITSSATQITHAMMAASMQRNPPKVHAPRSARAPPRALHGGTRRRPHTAPAVTVSRDVAASRALWGRGSVPPGHSREANTAQTTGADVDIHRPSQKKAMVQPGPLGTPGSSQGTVGPWAPGV